MNIENGALRPDRVLRYKKEMKALLIEVSVPSDFGLNNAEINKVTKYQDLKNEVKRSWKLKSTKIIPVVIGAMGMIKKNLTSGLVACRRIVLEHDAALHTRRLQRHRVAGSSPAEPDCQGGGK